MRPRSTGSAERDEPAEHREAGVRERPAQQDGRAAVRRSGSEAEHDAPRDLQRAEADGGGPGKGNERCDDEQGDAGGPEQSHLLAQQRYAEDSADERREDAHRRGEVRAHGLDREELGEASTEEVEDAARGEDRVLQAGEPVQLDELAGDEREETEQRH